MRLVVTGGGTGGHVFPALEIAQEAIQRGASVRYLGSLRGQEGEACRARGLPFLGFPTLPLYGLATVRGWRALAAFARARSSAIEALRGEPPDAIVSTGGFASAPVVAAARNRGIPFVVHEQNAVPGRANRILGRHAKAVATVFHAAAVYFPGVKVVRTGMPIRSALRRIADEEATGTGSTILVVGGSQGARALNEAAPAAASLLSEDLHWQHLAGPNRQSEVRSPHDRYRVEGSLDTDDMGRALAGARLVVCRSGAGTLAELAAFRRYSILVPYPHAFQDHQAANAREFVGLGAAEVLAESELKAETLASAIRARLDRVQGPWEDALREWDVRDAAARVLDLVWPD